MVPLIYPSALVVGLGRSGTSFAQRNIADLKGVRSPVEMSFLDEFLPGLVSRHFGRLHETEIRNEIDEHYYKPGLRDTKVDADRVIQVLRGRCRRPLDLWAAVTQVAADADRSEALLDGPVRILEKSPRNRWQWHVGHALPELRIVWMIRDPRAVVNSTLQTPWGRNENPAKVAEAWLLTLEQMQQARSELGSRVRVYDYDTVVSMGDDAFRSDLAGFLGISDQVSREGKVTIVRADEQAWKKNVYQPADSSRIDAWTNELDPQYIAWIDFMCGDAYADFGYKPAQDFKRDPRPASAIAAAHAYRAMEAAHIKSSRQRNLGASFAELAGATLV